MSSSIDKRYEVTVDLTVEDNGIAVSGISVTQTQVTAIGFLTGPQGLQGSQGPQGVQGVQGTQGNTGNDGATWYNGPTVPNNTLGKDSDYYLDTDNGQVYQKISGTWQTVTNITGPAGVGTQNNFNTVFVDQSPNTGSTYGALGGTINGTNAVFTVSQGKYVSSTLRVSLNGQEQTQGSSNDWVETSPTSGTFTFNTPPATGKIIQVTYIKSDTSDSDFVENIVAGTNITVDNTDPNNPIVSSATGITAIPSSGITWYSNPSNIAFLATLNDDGSLQTTLITGGFYTATYGATY